MPCNCCEPAGARTGLACAFTITAEKKTACVRLLDELESKEAYGRGAEPWEMANIMIFLASDYATYLTGEVISASSQRA